MKRSTYAFVGVVALGVLSTGARADGLLSQLYNTGVDDLGAKLSTAVPTVDTRYPLVSAPAGFTSAYAVNGFETGSPWAWMPSSVDYTDVNGVHASQWLSPIWTDGQAGNVGNTSPQQFNYTISFDLGAATNANIQGVWMADNSTSVDGSMIAQILVNGSVTGQTIDYSGAVDNGWGSFQSWHGFDLSGSYFHAGINTITFSVPNWPQGEGNPTGVRVAFTNAEAVPEPLGIAALAIGLVGVIRRRRSHR